MSTLLDTNLLTRTAQPHHPMHQLAVDAVASLRQQAEPVAYKPQPDGIEVLGVGWEETARFWPTSPGAAVKVVQP